MKEKELKFKDWQNVDEPNLSLKAAKTEECNVWKKNAKKAVATAKAIVQNKLYNKLNTPAS